uniref:Uncharacterized protein n=1 Tax=Kalanchoe fedtschenkoi TaxID=63787 RepID=A0A7N0UR75_KALFE
MKCRQHSADLSSAVGVCATCLRERLFVLISAQSRHSEPHYDDSRKSDPSLYPIFPRSVSPYVGRRKLSDATDLLRGCNASDRRFRSTPQVGPSAGGFQTTISESSKKTRSRFSFIASLFKSRSHKPESNSSPLWRPAVSKSKSAPKFVGERIQNRLTDRGMSPERPWCDDEEDSSSPSSESREPAWKQTPVSSAVAPSTRRRSHMSGFPFCLSPLVRASPNRNWNRNSLAAEGGEVAGASRKKQLAAANSFGKNRSKKMADFGRGGYNHRR